MSPTRRRGRGAMVWQVTAVTVVAALTVATAVFWPPIAARLGVSAPSPRVQVSTSPTASGPAGPSGSQSPGTPGPTGPVLAPLGSAAGVAPEQKAITPATLSARLLAVPRTGAGVATGVVLDATTGATLFDLQGDRPQIPASTMKVLTSVAALQLMPAQTRFSTRVLRTGTSSIVLVGGGDPLLASRTATGGYPRPASLADLAARTAAALKKQGLTRVTLTFDASLFPGAGWHPTWPAGYTSAVAPISALSADRGRPAGISQPNPALSAAQFLAAQLGAAGVRVTGTPTAATAPPTATPVASVDSLPLENLVEYALLHSDNVVTEVIARQAAIAAGQPATFAGSAAAVRSTLTGLGLTAPSMAIVDGSGLSRSNLVTARLLAAAMQRVAADDRFSAVRSGLPVAGATGTLANRLTGPASVAGQGWVRAKTGSLARVATLAGFTRTVDGRDVVFAFMSSGAADETAMRSWVDQMAATITACGC